MTGPGARALTDPALAGALDEVARRLAASGRVVLALDFDGVLAPLVDDPSTSRALPAAVTALRRLAQVERLVLALVSGRAVDDLAGLAEVPAGTWLVGSHGAERGRWTGERLERADRKSVV